MKITKNIQNKKILTYNLRFRLPGVNATISPSVNCDLNKYKNDLVELR